MKKRVLVLLVAIILLAFPEISTAKLVAGDYIDIHGHWAEQDIQLLDQLGIMNGTGTDAQGFRVFAPENSVTRAQLAKVLVDTFQLDYGQLRFIKQPVASDYYRDVENTSWYSNSVVMCAINQVFNPTEDYHFEPAANVTRMEIASAIYKSFHAKSISVPMIMMMPVYNDTEDLGQDDMNALVFVSNTGMMRGDGQNFRPTERVTRAEMARIINRCISLVNLNENNNDQDYSVKTGQTFILSLAGNPTTGYSWDFEQPIDNHLLELVSDNAYQFDSLDQMTVGQGGRFYWKLKALQPGTTEIVLRYARPWESVQPAQTFKIKININAATSVTSPQEITVISKSYNNLAPYMITDLIVPFIQGMADETIQKQLNDRFENDAFAIKTQLQSEIDAYVKDAQLYDYPIRDYVLYTRFQQDYLNHRILSLNVDYYQYTGGAHGITERRPYNIDLSTGQTLALKDLFNSNYDYAGVINQEIRQQISSGEDICFEGDRGFQNISEDQDYYLQDDALVIVFQQYEIAPYAAGIPEFKIPLSLFDGNIISDLVKTRNN